MNLLSFLDILYHNLNVAASSKLHYHINKQSVHLAVSSRQIAFMKLATSLKSAKLLACVKMFAVKFQGSVPAFILFDYVSWTHTFSHFPALIYKASAPLFIWEGIKKRANYNITVLQRQGTVLSAEKHIPTACCP